MASFLPLFSEANLENLLRSPGLPVLARNDAKLARIPGTEKKKKKRCDCSPGVNLNNKVTVCAAKILPPVALREKRQSSYLRC